MVKKGVHSRAAQQFCLWPGGGLCCGIRSVGWQQRLSELVLGFWLLRGGRMGKGGLGGSR